MLNRVRAFNEHKECVLDEQLEYDLQCGSYTCQSYFNEFFKDDFLNDDYYGAQTLIIEWENRNYVFTKR